MNRSVALVLAACTSVLLASCGKTISEVPNVPTCAAAEGCTAGRDPTGEPSDATPDPTQNTGPNDDVTDTTEACDANECVDGDGFCDVGFCDSCVRDDDCGDAPTDPSDPSDPTEPSTPGDLPECLEDECVDGDGFCDTDFCSTCPADDDCTSTDPNDPTEPNEPDDPTGPDPNCDGDECCLANECIAGDGFCDEDWCDGCDEDADCEDDANERCDATEDDDCCLANECIAGDSFCDEGWCEGCEVDPDC